MNFELHPLPYWMLSIVLETQGKKWEDVLGFIYIGSREYWLWTTELQPKPVTCGPVYVLARFDVYLPPCGQKYTMLKKSNSIIRMTEWQLGMFLTKYCLILIILNDFSKKKKMQFLRKVPCGFRSIAVRLQIAMNWTPLVSLGLFIQGYCRNTAVQHGGGRGARPGTPTE